MSKAIDKVTASYKGLKNAHTKFTAAAVPGNRLIPSKNKDNKPEQFPLRFDAGNYNEGTKKLQVIVQVNSQAKSPALVEWRKKNSSHGKLAEEEFDTAAADLQGEYKRMVDSAMAKAKENLKK